MLQRSFRTPPFLPEDDELAMRPPEAPMPVPEENLGPPPELRQSRPQAPPPELMPPDPTTTTSRPEIPPPPPSPAQLRWQDDEDLYRSIQAQRPQMKKPGILNTIAGAAMGGLGGYLASSHRPGAQATGQRALAMAPDLLHPGHRQRMQEWTTDLDLAKARADRGKEALKMEEGLREGESNRDFKKKQGAYYEALPGIRSEQAAAAKAAKMVTITPEIAKELGYDDSRIGDEISVAQYGWDKKQKGFRDHDAAKMSELEAKLKAREDEVSAITQRLKELEEMRGTTRKDVAKTSADARVKAAGISANKPTPAKLIPRGVTRGGKTYVAYLDSEGQTVVTDHELGAASARQDPFLAKLFAAQPNAGEPAKAATAVKANQEAPTKKIKVRDKTDGKSGLIDEKDFDPKIHERL